ncbi:hypothetical protein [Arenibacter algicola]|uniref:Uncharacterized protein n=1 Tax=Arenibacter algicola TaxID=616991 RepID=A0A221V3J9_9FLAO|nr:hypothetical protein [Arenibacter algicola]ASO07968.1 hypothetical protein AREALGSMS7_04570 [Arenibacter algicola]
MKRKTPSLSLSSLVSQVMQAVKKTSMKILMFIFLLAAIVLAALAIINRIYQVPFNLMTSDPTAIAGIHPLSGVLSNLGIILWCFAACSCTLAAMILRSIGTKKLYLFLLYSSLLSTFLILDDLFQFHEDLSTLIGLNQKVVYVLLATAVITYLSYFRELLFQTDI